MLCSQEHRNFWAPNKKDLGSRDGFGAACVIAVDGQILLLAKAESGSGTMLQNTNFTKWCEKETIFQQWPVAHSNTLLAWHPPCVWSFVQYDWIWISLPDIGSLYISWVVECAFFSHSYLTFRCCVGEVHECHRSLFALWVITSHFSGE